MTTISNTEVTSANTCLNQHKYAYDWQIEPKESKPHLYRGEWGHAALDAYYFEMKEGASLNTCFKAAQGVIAEEIAFMIEQERFDRVEILTDIVKYLREYVEFYGKEPFRVLAVEEEYKAPLSLGINYMMRLDLLIEYTSGEFRGDLVVVDHKWLYNFKTPTELELDAQLPKFINTLKANGYTISKGIFNQIRYRKDAKERFKREPARNTTKHAMDQIWHEQRETAQKINAEKSKLPGDKQEPVRVLNPLICKHCDYSPLCIAELNGQDTTRMVHAEYKARDRPFRDVE